MKITLWWLKITFDPKFASPIPIPVIAFSEVGISNTLSFPNFSNKSSVV